MKLGCLPYLNVKPLVYGFENGSLPDGWELVYARPSELAKMLHKSEIDAAPVSSFATFAGDLEICPDICISSDGEVRSVLMFSNTEIKNIKNVALDSASLSGANLLKILLRESYNIDPKYTTIANINISDAITQYDAVFAIGDPAMTFNGVNFSVFDVGLEWKKLTGLPTVFAVWAGKGINGELIKVLKAEKERGSRLIGDIAKSECLRLDLSYDFCVEYLSKIIRYDMGEKEKESLRLFREKALMHGLSEGCSNEQI